MYYVQYFVNLTLKTHELIRAEYFIQSDAIFFRFYAIVLFRIETTKNRFLHVQNTIVYIRYTYLFRCMDIGEINKANEIKEIFTYTSYSAMNTITCIINVK